MDEETAFNEHAALIFRHIRGKGSLPAKTYIKVAKAELDIYAALSVPQNWRAKAGENAVGLRSWLHDLRKIQKDHP